MHTVASESIETDGSHRNAPASGLMKAAVYNGEGSIDVQDVEKPRIGPGELLVRVEACGVCHTDLKKIEYDLLAPPRIFGHETAGVVVEVGAGVSKFRVNDRVVAFHHIPCRNCFYCDRKLYAQCPGYKRVGITAGYEPAGGGFSQYVRVMDWIVRDGVLRIPDEVSFAVAALVEPVNTCLKAVVQANPQPGDVCLVLGQGPIGLIFTMLLNRVGATVVATDTIERRLQLSRQSGAQAAWNARTIPDLPAEVKKLSEGRGADLAIVATSAPGLVEQAVRCTRPGAQILLFSQTSDKERIELSGVDICVGERAVFGSYSASIDLQSESARLVFDGKLPLKDLISHCLPLDQIRAGIDLALHPDDSTLKIIIEPQRCSQ